MPKKYTKDHRAKRAFAVRKFVDTTYTELDRLDTVKNQLIILQNAVAHLNFADQIALLNDIEGKLRAARLDTEAAFGGVDASEYE